MMGSKNADKRYGDTRPGKIPSMKPQVMDKQDTDKAQPVDDDAWFNSPEAQRRHQEALEDVEKGRVERFDDTDDFLKSIKSA